MSDFYLDPGIVVKQEPAVETTMNISASVPIPLRRPDGNDYRTNLVIDFDASSQSPHYQDLLGSQVQSPEPFDTTTMWGNKLLEVDDDQLKGEGLLQMDDDDIFQVNKADLIQGPTLAELNANDENLFADLNFDDLYLPGESTYNYLNMTNSISGVQSNQGKFAAPFMQIHNSNNLNNNESLIATSCPAQSVGFYKELDISTASLERYTKTALTFSPNSQSGSNSSLHFHSPSPTSSPLQQKHSTLHDLLKRGSTSYDSPERVQPQQQQQQQQQQSQCVPLATTATTSNSAAKLQPRLHSSRLSSSAPTQTHLPFDQLWQRREPRPHLLSTGSLAEAGSTSSISTSGVLSPEAHDFSQDELESDEDSDHYEEYSTDDSDDDDDHSHKNSKKERYFWQYNVQAKGPKGQRLILKTKTENPHVLNEITDPVFSPDCAVRGIKHSGKARKGDGNDLTPNPKKLYNIGKELDKLGKVINDMTPVSELPFNVRPKTRKEKNKLASRACRLKKKAQHEANKIKLQGLETEHKKLLNGINQAKQIFAIKLNNSTPGKQEELTNHLDKIVKSATKVRIAGQTTEYVNKILEKVKCGGIHLTMDDYM